MKKITKIITTLTLCSILAPTALADKIANPTAPYNASEAVTMFNRFYANKYDKINEDLHSTTATAKEKWSDQAMIAQFRADWMDDTTNRYYFDYLNPSDTETIYQATQTVDEENPWTFEEKTNDEAITNPLSHVNLTLRKLIPAMQNDVRLLPALDRGISEEDNTSMFITLKEDANQVSTWYVEFQVSGSTPEKNKTYLVWVSAEDTVKPQFKAVRKK